MFPLYRNQSVDFSANQLTGFYMMGTLVVKGLIGKLYKYIHTYIHTYIHKRRNCHAKKMPWKSCKVLCSFCWNNAVPIKSHAEIKTKICARKISHIAKYIFMSAIFPLLYIFSVSGNEILN